MEVEVGGPQIVNLRTKRKKPSNLDAVMNVEEVRRSGRWVEKNRREKKGGGRETKKTLKRERKKEK